MTQINYVCTRDKIARKTFNKQTRKDVTRSKARIDLLDPPAGSPYTRLSILPERYEREEIPLKLLSNSNIANILAEEEKDMLSYLSKLEVEEYEDIKSGYRINFYFEENPYFENDDVLTKEFHLGSSGDPVSQSTTINWKAGVDLSKTAKAKAAMKGRKRPLGHRSFFDWFTDHGDPSSDEIAELIKDDLWPNPLQYYLAPDMEIENGIEGDEIDSDDEEDEDEDGVDEDGADEEGEGELGEGEEGDDSVEIMEDAGDSPNCDFTNLKLSPVSSLNSNIADDIKNFLSNDELNPDAQSNADDLDLKKYEKQF